jgi:hypothetical protein
MKYLEALIYLLLSFLLLIGRIILVILATAAVAIFLVLDLIIEFLYGSEEIN